MGKVTKQIEVTVRIDGCFCSPWCPYFAYGECVLTPRDRDTEPGEPYEDIDIPIDHPSAVRGETTLVRTKWCVDTFEFEDIQDVSSQGECAGCGEDLGDSYYLCTQRNYPDHHEVPYCKECFDFRNANHQFIETSYYEQAKFDDKDFYILRRKDEDVR